MELAYTGPRQMTATDDLYAAVKPEMTAIATHLIELSQRFLRESGNFLPHAAVSTADGKVEFVAAMAEAKDGYTNSTEVLPLLQDGLRQKAKEQALAALGIAENVTITPEGKSTTQAIKVLFEHRQGLTVALYMPFKKQFLRGYSYGDIFSMLATPEVNAWRGDTA